MAPSVSRALSAHYIKWGLLCAAISTRCPKWRLLYVSSGKTQTSPPAAFSSGHALTCSGPEEPGAEGGHCRGMNTWRVKDRVSAVSTPATRIHENTNAQPLSFPQIDIFLGSGLVSGQPWMDGWTLLFKSRPAGSVL